jgi:hypothetical protein
MSSASAVNRPVASRDSATRAVSGDVYAWDYKDFRDKIFKVDAACLRMERDPEDVLPQELGTICRGSMHAVNTFGDGACAVHAVFGIPTPSRNMCKLYRPAFGPTWRSSIWRERPQMMLTRT